MFFSLSITTIIVSALLIFLLAIREILRWESGPFLASFLKALNIVIIPLLVVFIIVLAYNLEAILNSL